MTSDKPIHDTPADDDIEIPLDDIFAELPPPDVSDAQRAIAARRAQNKRLAEKALANWHPIRRVLYVYRVACKSCGQIYDTPSEHLLTEYQTGDGTKKWAKADILSAHLPIEQETIAGHSCDICQNCLEAE